MTPVRTAGRFGAEAIDRDPAPGNPRQRERGAYATARRRTAPALQRHEQHQRAVVVITQAVSALSRVRAADTPGAIRVTSRVR